MTIQQARQARPGTARPGTARPGTARPTARALRLTRRGRAVVLLVLVSVALVAFSLGRVSTAAGSGAAAPPERETVVVQPGETLWSIARRVAPGADPRVTVARLRDLNDLDGPLQAGQRLTLLS